MILTGVAVSSSVGQKAAAPGRGRLRGIVLGFVNLTNYIAPAPLGVGGAKPACTVNSEEPH